MWKKLKKPLLFVGATGAVGTAAYFAFAKSSEKITEIQDSPAPPLPKTFSNLKYADKKSLSGSLQAAQYWAKQEGYEKVAKNWLSLFCEEEKNEDPKNKEYCD